MRAQCSCRDPSTALARRRLRQTSNRNTFCALLCKVLSPRGAYTCTIALACLQNVRVVLTLGARRTLVHSPDLQFLV